MSNTRLKYITGKTGTTVSKHRVFCSFHPDNKKTADNVMNDIISACDCTVFFYEEGNGPVEPDELEYDLSEMALFVLVVSSEFLFTPSFARDVVYDFAVSHMIPVLPIMIENGLEIPFNKHMGNLQYLLMNMEKYDATSVPYAEKLSNYLSQVLTADRDVQRLRDAFDTSIFLSYRKKDRRFAQELMNMIHSDESCRGIAIWYDEFLVPGEDFNDGIKAELEGSSACILVVTPHIVEKNNYITITEYPMAISIGKAVIPFEMLPTDRSELAEAYPGLSEPMSTLDADQVRCTILSIIENLGVKPMESSEEREYLRGFAYLKGIYVEKNIGIGVQMILGAAEKGVEDAIETVVQMYRNGDGVSLSLEKAELWQKKYIEIKERTYLERQTDEDAETLIRAYFELCHIYEQGEDFQSAVDVYKQITDLCSYSNIKDKDFSKELRATAFEASAILEMNLGKYSSARYVSLSSALDVRKEQYETRGSMLSRLKLTEIYALIAECCEKCEDIPGVKTNIIYIKQIIPSPDDITDMGSDQYEILRRILICNNRLGHLYNFTDKWSESFLCIGNSVLLAEKLTQISDTYDARRQLVLAHMNDGDQHANKNVENHLRVAEAAYARAYTEAIMLLAEGESTAEFRRDIARITQKQGRVQKNLGALNQSKALYFDAIQNLRDLNDMCGTLPAKKELYDCLREAAQVYAQADDMVTCEKLLKESIELSGEAVENSELAVYKKDKAAALVLLADVYKKQWDMDEAFRCRKEQCTLLRSVMDGTGRVGDMKAFAVALKDTLSVAKLAGEFAEAKALEDELRALIEKYKMFFND